MRIDMSRRLGNLALICVLSSLLALSVSLLVSQSALAASGILKDDAHVLNAQQVMAEANNLSKTIDIYTTNSFNGDKNAFEDDIKEKANKEPGHFEMGIDTAHRYFWLQGGSNIELKQSQYDAAYEAFKNKVGSNNYTEGTLALLRSLEESLKGGNTSDGFGEGAHSALVCLGALALGIGLFFFNRLTGGRFRGYRRHHSWHGGYSGGGGFGGGGGGGGAGGSF
ncbi:hypothetical protein [Ktedonospora formicarum]|uniref:TPM domain-containing protein n=1 Tax=Ktedonospora formicarum TaxID=2778364 RepID=A0A8J3MNM2_9CHLR|nr:hypothetical protein [Ktedonospora formicarum]GHO42912.1 hypothetical protein KSX_10750 [Ktedonospora formicarum]